MKNKKCYIIKCDYKPENPAKNPHIKIGVMYKNKHGQPSCWWHEKGYFLGEKIRKN